MKPMIRSAFILLVSCFTFSTTMAISDLGIGNLRCNYAVNPIGLDDFNPSFSWNLTSPTRGQSQTAYQVIVGSSANFSENNALWNTGKVASSQSVHISYKGSPLQYGKRYYWKVKVWDVNGAESTYS